jgi:hypothetical protein
MIKRLDPFILIGFLIIGIPLLGATIVGCSKPDATEVANPENKWIKVDGMHVHEIHPRLGVTCYVVYNNGISCLKD